MADPERVTICDVGPRDGLQNEAAALPVEARLELIRSLAASGLRRIEAASFVDAARVPAMAGAEEIFAGLDLDGPVAYPALILNAKGYDRALAADAREVRYAFAATDEFGTRNQGRTSAEGLAEARGLIRRARADGIGIGVTISVAFGCPFAGPVSRERVAGLVAGLTEDSPDEICLADTIGVAVPTVVAERIGDAVGAGASVTGHFHDTRNTGVANAVAAVAAGARSLDASVGGTGGCPFAPAATGNVATEDLVYTLEGMGIATGVDLAALIETSHRLGARLGRELPSMVARAGIPDPAIA